MPSRNTQLISLILFKWASIYKWRLNKRNMHCNEHEKCVFQFELAMMQFVEGLYKIWKIFLKMSILKSWNAQKVWQSKYHVSLNKQIYTFLCAFRITSSMLIHVYGKDDAFCVLAARQWKKKNMENWKKLFRLDSTAFIRRNLCKRIVIKVAEVALTKSAMNNYFKSRALSTSFSNGTIIINNEVRRDWLPSKPANVQGPCKAYQGKRRLYMYM